jgi:alpha-acetolactate decarboxylase
MKIRKLWETLIIVFSLFANTMFLFSQESKPLNDLSDEAKCPSLIVTPSNRNVTSASGTTGFTVTSNISWTSTSDQSWCSVTPSGRYNGTINAVYEANTGAGARIATIKVSGSGVSDQVVTVTQVGSASVLIVTPANRNVTSLSGTTSFGVASNIGWTSSSNQAWCTVTPSGNGNGTITATYQANTGAGSRVATITVSGSGVNDQLVTVTQLGTAPALIVTPLNQNVTSSSGTTSFNVASNIEWTSLSDQPWCTVAPSGTGNGTIMATYQANTITNSRTATITVMGPGVTNQVVTVTQSGVPPSLTVTPINQTVTSPSGTTSFDVVSNIDWTSSSDQLWCSVTPSGTGNGTVTATYQANTTALIRVATITITGPGVSAQTVTVTQDELITISYSGSPWCPSADIQNVLLSGTSGGTYSAQPAGLDIDPVTGSIAPGTSVAGSYMVKYSVEKPPDNRVLEASTDVAIRVTVAPQVAIKWDDVLICPNLDNEIISYQWFNGTTPISGATKQFYLTSKIPGIYAVEVVDQNGCKTMSDEISITGTKSIVIYPNPVKSSFTISLSDVPAGRTHIRINDVSGMEVMNLDPEISDSGFSREISVSTLDNGIYFVQVIVNEVYFYSGKIMVMK